MAGRPNGRPFCYENTRTNSIVDALREHGVRDGRMPATPVRIWQAMQGTDQ
jgi:hypothetical protein